LRMDIYSHTETPYSCLIWKSSCTSQPQTGVLRQCSHQCHPRLPQEELSITTSLME
ncbi:hypothetical protein NDU88_005097, partial [Pleurodeles waltl]